MQGHNLALAAAEKQDLVWKSFMYDLKQGTLKFLLNAGIDTLPTAANLKLWKNLLQISANCAKVDRPQTMSSAFAKLHRTVVVSHGDTTV